MKLNLKVWMEKYYWIAETMGYSVEEDRKATSVLAKILRDVEPPILDLEKTLRGKSVLLFGAGPSLDEKLEYLTSRCSRLLEDLVLVAADGASTALLEYKLKPHIVVSDLDGGRDALLECAEKGSIMVIHGHGDNVELIKEVVPEILSLTRKVLGTTQVEPVYPLYNFGGFTDGDRAVFLSWSFNCKNVVMAGMDFGDIVGRRSKPWLFHDVEANSEKKLKLRIGEELISWLAKKFKVKVYTLSSRAPEGVVKVGFKDIHAIVK